MFLRFNAYNTHTHTPIHTHAHTHARTHACTMHTRMHTYRVVYQGNKTEENVFERKGFEGRFERTDSGRMADRNRELVPSNWSLVRERALTTGLCLEGWYSEHSGVCRRGELPGRSVKVKQFWKVDGGWMRNDLKDKDKYLYMPYLVSPVQCMCMNHLLALAEAVQFQSRV